MFIFTFLPAEIIMLQLPGILSRAELTAPEYREKFNEQPKWPRVHYLITLSLSLIKKLLS